MSTALIGVYRSFPRFHSDFPQCLQRLRSSYKTHSRTVSYFCPNLIKQRQPVALSLYLKKRESSSYQGVELTSNQRPKSYHIPSAIHEKSAKMKEMRIINKTTKEKLTITMEICGKLRQMNRLRNEELTKTLQRIAATLKTEQDKAMRIKNRLSNGENIQSALKSEVFNTGSDPTTMQLLDKNDVEISGDRRVDEALCNAKVFHMHNTPYKVVYNVPTVTSVQLPSSPLVGMTLYPQAQFDFASHDHSKYTWYRYFEPDVELEKPAKKMKTEGLPESENWEFVSVGKFYTPTDQDIGYRFKVEVHPGSDAHPSSQDKGHSDSLPVSAVTSSVVRAGPTDLLFETRPGVHHPAPADASMRVASYNILADCYATSDYARSDLFPYCPDEAIQMDYRIQLVMKELYAYKADILCLQEVDRFVFENHLVSALSLENYAGALATKMVTKEGVALFYNR